MLIPDVCLRTDGVANVARCRALPGLRPVAYTARDDRTRADQRMPGEYAATVSRGEVRGGANRPAPDLPVPRGDFRRRSRLQQYRGMVSVHPRGSPAVEGSALLSSSRAKCRGWSL